MAYYDPDAEIRALAAAGRGNSQPTFHKVGKKYNGRGLQNWTLPLKLMNQANEIGRPKGLRLSFDPYDMLWRVAMAKGRERTEWETYLFAACIQLAQLPSVVQEGTEGPAAKFDHLAGYPQICFDNQPVVNNKQPKWLVCAALLPNPFVNRLHTLPQDGNIGNISYTPKQLMPIFDVMRSSTCGGLKGHAKHLEPIKGNTTQAARSDAIVGGLLLPPETWGCGNCDWMASIFSYMGLITKGDRPEQTTAHGTLRDAATSFHHSQALFVQDGMTIIAYRQPAENCEKVKETFRAYFLKGYEEHKQRYPKVNIPGGVLVAMNLDPATWITRALGDESDGEEYEDDDEEEVVEEDEQGYLQDGMDNGNRQGHNQDDHEEEGAKGSVPRRYRSIPRSDGPSNRNDTPTSDDESTRRSKSTLSSNLGMHRMSLNPATEARQQSLRDLAMSRAQQRPRSRLRSDLSMSTASKRHASSEEDENAPLIKRSYNRRG